ncbi:MAG TPA: hypothetical protein VFS25_03240 [Chitinophaga sp.]|uniref:hypothetical protein n=1 Tax=Chitinophaga sp. TaxID=1869181 RepID=UPI002DBF1EF5|nr:hypothetical protein [Chitinophaga sp.]HEU4551815.1 hypothetical protein [Chitinophaga sp.]
MHNTMLTIHSLLRWVVLLTGIWACVRALRGVNGKTPFTAADNKASLFFSISLDVQFLVGLILYFVTSPLMQTARADFGAAMKDNVLRFFAVEHTTMALLALILVHIGRSKVKKAGTAARQHKLALIFYGIALLLILALIPWPFRTELGRGWF